MVPSVHQCFGDQRREKAINFFTFLIHCFMTYIKYILFFTLLLFFGTEAVSQVSFPGSCVYFKYACTGSPASFPGAGAKVFCNRSNYNVQLISYNGNVDRFCWNDYLNCSTRDRNGICLLYKNWHLCSNGSGNVFQTLPRNSSINGVVLGNYPGEDWSGTSACIGRNYLPLNNNIYSATEIEKCPSDPAILKVPNLELPVLSQQVLSVRITNTSGQLINQSSYQGSSLINGDEIDISNQIDVLFSGTYIIELSLVCRTGGTGCSPVPNTVKRSYIEIVPDVFEVNMNYQVNGTIFTTCFIPIGILSSASPGINIGYDASCHNGYSLSLSNLANYGNANMSYSLSRKFCSDSGPYNPLGTATIPANQISNGFYAIGSPPLSDLNQCYCYRLDVTYFNICTGTNSTRSGYYRIGNPCTGFQPEPGSEESSKKLPVSSSNRFSLYPNPVDETFSISWVDMNFIQAELSIYNVSGQLVKKVDLSSSKEESTVKLNGDFPAGAYHYSIKWDGGLEAGTFIKK